MELKLPEFVKTLATLHIPMMVPNAPLVIIVMPNCNVKPYALQTTIAQNRTPFAKLTESTRACALLCAPMEQHTVEPVLFATLSPESVPT